MELESSTSLAEYELGSSSLNQFLYININYMCHFCHNPVCGPKCIPKHSHPWGGGECDSWLLITKLGFQKILGTNSKWFQQILDPHKARSFLSCSRWQQSVNLSAGEIPSVTVSCLRFLLPRKASHGYVFSKYASLYIINNRLQWVMEEEKTLWGGDLNSSHVSYKKTCSSAPSVAMTRWGIYTRPF